MKTLKMLICAVMVLCMTFTLCACGNGADDTVPTDEPTASVPQVTEPVQTTAPVQVESGYTVKVVDENGNPIPGALVQLCKELCYPNVTDANGEAFFNLAQDEYKVSFLSLPAGYTYSGEEQEFYFDGDATELTIVLKAEG